MSFNVAGVPLIYEGVEHIVTERGQTGFVLFGPYAEYEAGYYYVTFKVLPSDDSEGNPSDLVAVVDVAAAEGRVILATGNVFRRRATERHGVITLRFEVPQRERLEFRVQSTGRAKLIIRSERRVEADGAGLSRYCPVLGLGEVPTNGFIDTYFQNILYAHEHGLVIDFEHGRACISIGRVSLNIDNTKDFQLLDEVFIKNDYRYRLNREHLVVDVGMNAGFASLFFANGARVRAVHAFEPFARPYGRAMSNFGRNPELAARIAVHRFGLSDHDEDIEVNTVEGFTLGMTIKGLDRGSPETIRVRSAARAPRPIIESAEAQNWAVVVKLDCEGSEFPIFKSLAEDDLLDRIDILMIEWHKEWSPDCSQDDLTAVLVERGFAVFDHTIASSQIAGMLYAVRQYPPLDR